MHPTTAEPHTDNESLSAFEYVFLFLTSWPVLYGMMAAPMVAMATNFVFGQCTVAEFIETYDKETEEGGMGMDEKGMPAGKDLGASGVVGGGGSKGGEETTTARGRGKIDEHNAAPEVAARRKKKVTTGRILILLVLLCNVWQLFVVHGLLILSDDDDLSTFSMDATVASTTSSYTERWCHIAASLLLILLHGYCVMARPSSSNKLNSFSSSSTSTTDTPGGAFGSRKMSKDKSSSSSHKATALSSSSSSSSPSQTPPPPPPPSPSSFCSTCRMLVYDRDHHCYVIHNCVGRHNRKAFILLLCLGLCLGGWDLLRYGPVASTQYVHPTLENISGFMFAATPTPISTSSISATSSSSSSVPGPPLSSSSGGPATTTTTTTTTTAVGHVTPPTQQQQQQQQAAADPSSHTHHTHIETLVDVEARAMTFLTGLQVTVGACVALVVLAGTVWLLGVQCYVVLMGYGTTMEWMKSQSQNAAHRKKKKSEQQKKMLEEEVDEEEEKKVQWATHWGWMIMSHWGQGSHSKAGTTEWKVGEVIESEMIVA